MLKLEQDKSKELENSIWTISFVLDAVDIKCSVTIVLLLLLLLLLFLLNC
jgi:hypothetical protein